ncbi:MAG: sugar phosphate nucleotidyltransferase [Ilumatobacteraceae bacterium]
MHAVVLVGGFGTRLRPLTNTVPKPLLPLGQRTILEWLMVHLARGGVTDAVLALGFKPEPFMQAFPDAQCAGVRLSYAIEDSPLDTAGAIGFAARAAGIHERGEAFVVANGDIVTDLSVASLVARHKSNVRAGAMATIHLTPVDDPSQYGVVEFDSESAGVTNTAINKVRGFIEKPAPGTSTSRHVNAGTYVLEASALALMPGDAPLSIERATFPELVRRGALFAHPTDDYWLDAGRPDTYRRANLDLVGGRRSDRDIAVHASARVASSAQVSDSVVGAAARIGDGAVVTSSVIFPGAVIGANARVTGCSVMGSVPDGVVVNGQLVAN